MAGRNKNTNNAGWIRIHRKLLDNPIWYQSPPAYGKIWITMLLMANHEDNEWYFCGEKIKCKRGQFVTSIKSIREASGSHITTNNVRGALATMLATGLITSKPTRKGRLITIVNWELYQGGKKTTHKVTHNVSNNVTNNVTHNVTPQKVTPNNNIKNIKEKKEYKEKENLSSQEVKKEEEGDPNWFANLVDETDWSKFEKTRGEDNV